MRVHELFEYSSANPFVGLVTNIDLKIKEVETAQSSHASTIYTTSLKSALGTLLHFIESAEQWNVPEKKLRGELHAALPAIKSHVKAALASASNPAKAREHLFAARKIAVKKSHLYFGEIT